MVAQTKTVSPGFTEMTKALVDGEADVCYQGWAYQNLAAQAGNKTVKTKTPKEGVPSATSTRSRPRPTTPTRSTPGSTRPSSRSTNARIAEYLVAAVTVEASADLINADTKALYPYDDLELGDTTGERLNKLFVRTVLRQPADRVRRVRHVRRDAGGVGGDQAERVTS